MRKTALLVACGLAVATAGVSFGDTIWGIDNAADMIGTFDSGSPGTFNGIGNSGITSGFVNNLEFDGAGNLWASDGATLFSINKTTGAATAVGGHGITNGETMTDFAFNNGTMYGIATLCGGQSSIYTIDLSSGAATFVCTTDLVGACDVGLTFDGSGVAYGHDLVFDVIYSVDLSTCTTSTVVSLPYNSNFGQALAGSGGTMYHVAFNSDAFQGELYSFDGTGAYNFLGVLGPLQIAGADVEGGSSDCLTMVVSKLTAGQTGKWGVSGATPGAKVAVVYGLAAGKTVVNGQAGFCATFGIKGVNSNKLIGMKNADGSGNATISKKIPGFAAGLTVYTQAAEQGTCPKECVSNLDKQTIQ